MTADQGRVVLVTGAARGIGAATAVEFGKRGDTVIINYEKSDQEATAVAEKIRSHGGKAHVLRADISDPAQAAELFRKIDESFGPLDVLVCNAGVIRDNLLGASTAGEFDRVISVNLGGVVNCCREASRRMISRRRGVILNVSSAAAQKPGRGQSAYAASKGGVESFTRALAVELAPRGIRVNAVAPGVIATSMTEEIRGLAEDQILKKILLKRIGSPEEVARVIIFLCGDDASYVTGQVWSVDGGFKAE